MSATQPYAKTVFPWLRANLGKGSLAVLTGTDTKALMAAVQIVELYSYCREARVAQAFGLMVLVMQPTARELAFHAIAHVMDWGDRWELWDAASLPPLGSVRVCEFDLRSGGKGGAS